MAVKTNWLITHRCGHQQEHDLSGRKAGDRAGFAKWLADKDCTACWQKARPSGPSEEQKAAERADVAAFETRAGFDPLEGSEKAVAWGARVRYQTLRDARASLVPDTVAEEDWVGRVERPAKTVRRASWWLDNFTGDDPCAPEDLPELLEGIEPDEVCENIETGNWETEMAGAAV